MLCHWYNNNAVLCYVCVCMSGCLSVRVCLCVCACIHVCVCVYGVDDCVEWIWIRVILKQRERQTIDGFVWFGLLSSVCGACARAR